MGKIIEFRKPTLSELREKRNLTLSACARAVGVQSATLRRWEEGKTQPNIYQACFLCRLYGISPDHVQWSKE